MVDYLVYAVQAKPGFSDIVIASLGEFGFESFEVEDDLVKAYIVESDYKEVDQKLLQQAVSDFINGQSKVRKIEAQNWNAVWESNYEPVEIGNFCRIRASFHPPKEGFKFELLIDPKMSFGTGHHATTSSVIEIMEGLEFANKRVLDMGCGTGVLAILAAKLAAREVVAIDIEDWSVENTLENCEKNGVIQITGLAGGKELLHNLEVFDIILANINKNILFDQAAEYSSAIKKQGYLVLSGFLIEDVADVEQFFGKHQFSALNTVLNDQWAAMLLQKNN